MTQLSAIEQAKVKLAVQKAPTSAPTPNANKVEEKVFQTYNSSLPNQRIPMPNGRLIAITAGQYITDKKDEIEFLDAEIEAGFPFLQKGATMTSSELDPMSALRTRIIAEAIASGAVVAAPELTNTEPQKMVPASTSDLAAVAAGSSSQAS
jgi:hypothetical protein